MRAITFYCELVQAAVLDGLQTELMKSGGDVGAAIETPVEPALADTAVDGSAVEAPSTDTAVDGSAVEAPSADTAVDGSAVEAPSADTATDDNSADVSSP